jgi:hypothetical protein
MAAPINAIIYMSASARRINHKTISHIEAVLKLHKQINKKPHPLLDAAF